MDVTLPEQIESEHLVIRAARPGEGAMFRQTIVDTPDRRNLAGGLRHTRIHPMIGCHSTSH